MTRSKTSPAFEHSSSIDPSEAGPSDTSPRRRRRSLSISISNHDTSIELGPATPTVQGRRASLSSAVALACYPSHSVVPESLSPTQSTQCLQSLTKYSSSLYQSSSSHSPTSPPGHQQIVPPTCYPFAQWSAFDLVFDQTHTLAPAQSSWLPSHYGYNNTTITQQPNHVIPWPSASDSGAPDLYCPSEAAPSTPTVLASNFSFTHHPTAGDLIYSTARRSSHYEFDRLTLPAMSADALNSSSTADTSTSSLLSDLHSDVEESCSSFLFATSQLEISAAQRSTLSLPVPESFSFLSCDPSLPVDTSQSCVPSARTTDDYTIQRQPSVRYADAGQGEFYLAHNSGRFPSSPPATTSQDDIGLDSGSGAARKRKRVASKLAFEDGLHWLDLSMLGGEGDNC